MSNLIEVFRSSSQEEQLAFIEAIKGSSQVSNDFYSALSRLESDKEEKAAKQAEIEKGYKLRAESAARFRAKYPNT